MSVQVAGDNNKILQVATVSANNDEVIGGYIAQAYEKIGHDGVIDVDKSNSLQTNVKVADGFKFDKGWISPLFLTDRAKEIAEFENPIILLYDKKITHHTQIARSLELSIQSNRPLLIICEDAEGDGLAMLGMNNVQQRIRVCVVKSPSFGDGRRDYMEDIALLTGGTYVSDLHGLDVKQVEMAHFGTAKKVIVSRDETVIIGGYGDKQLISELVNDLKMNLVQAKTEDDKAPIEKRIARLTGGVAVIEVGAATETELGEKLDRYDDAIRATKAAISDGIVAGGGTAFLRIADKFSFYDNGTDFEKGKNFAFGCLFAPIKQILENAGLDSGTIIKNVLLEEGNIGYNLKSGKLEDLMETGIIDSTKALKCALVNASSVAGSAITSEAIIVTVS
jgi:chaperonin GroEL